MIMQAGGLPFPANMLIIAIVVQCNIAQGNNVLLNQSHGMLAFAQFARVRPEECQCLNLIY